MFERIVFRSKEFLCNDAQIREDIPVITTQNSREAEMVRGNSTGKHYDYIIVGTGPGGATVARELAKTKKAVVMPVPRTWPWPSRGAAARS